MGSIKKSFIFHLNSIKDSHLVPKPAPGFVTLFTDGNGDVYKKNDAGKVVSIREEGLKKFDENQANHVGFWIDGRKVFEKVIYFSDGSSSIDIDMEPMSIDLIVDHSAFFYNEDRTVQATANDFASYDLENMKINLNNTSNADWEGFVRFKFIKK